ncbi:ABC transporter substrate-binding protein [Paenibacillus sp. MBLB4367]|uniref:ABC transporter substrate-binding protein n=1 Tax=Paenibacillus sp. MBLB4367 TaxID=3384767 RepID=UPI003907E813
MKRKWLTAALALTVVVLPACAKKTEQGASPSPGGTTETGKQVTLKYALWGQAQIPAMEEIIAKFKTTHPNINVTIEHTPYKQYFQKMETAAIGENLPDVLWINGPNIIKYAANGQLMDITGKISQDKLDMGNYPASLVQLYTVNGKNYGVPKDYDTIGLWYNKKMFDAAGVKYPDANWDWNTLVDAAKKLTDPSKGVWGIAAALDGQGGYYNTIPQAGGYVISEDKKTSGYDKPEAIQGLKFWTDLIHVHKVSPTLAQMTDSSPLSMFQSGKVAMFYDGSWSALDYSKNEYTKDKVDVAVLPKNKQQAVVIHGLGNVIAAKTKYPNEAWEFLKFLASKEAADIQAKTGAVIPAFNGTQDAWVKSMPNFNLKAFIDMVGYSKPYPASKDTAKWNTLETDILQKAWSGEMKVEEAAKQLGQKMNEALAQEK